MFFMDNFFHEDKSHNFTNEYDEDIENILN